MIVATHGASYKGQGATPMHGYNVISDPAVLFTFATCFWFCPFLCDLNGFAVSMPVSGWFFTRDKAKYLPSLFNDYYVALTHHSGASSRPRNRPRCPGRGAGSPHPQLSPPLPPRLVPPPTHSSHNRSHPSLISWQPPPIHPSSPAPRARATVLLSPAAFCP